MGGHYHRNLLFDCDGIADVLNRSNLRDKDGVNGYSIISVTDSIRFFEKRVGQSETQWLSLPFSKKVYGKSDEALRPDFSVNKEYKNVRRVWHKSLRGGLYSTPVTDGKRLYIGDDIGCMYALDL